MKQRISLVTGVKALSDGRNGEKRFTLNHGRSKFSIIVMKDGDDFDAEDLVNKKVISTQRDINVKDADGVETVVQQWYFDQIATEEALDSLMNEDLDYVLKQRKISNNLQVAKQYDLTYDQLTALI